MTQVLTAEQTSILNGSMLGDGSLQLDKENRSKNARLIIRRSIKDNAYLLWEYSMFKMFCSKNAIREYLELDKRTQKFYSGVSFTTLSHPIFTEYHNNWYNDIKRVPHNLLLDQSLMLIWFLDDGCIVRSPSDKFIVQFSTDGFSEDDVLFLCELLQHKYGQKYTPYQNSYPENPLQAGLRIYGYGPSADAIINDIRSIYPYDLMARKATWAQPYITKTHSFDKKRDMIDFYLSDKSVFYTNDLGRFAGFCFQRKPKLGRKGRIEVASGNLRKYYLSKHQDNGLIVKLEDDNCHLGHKYGVTEKGKEYFSLGDKDEIQ